MRRSRGRALSSLTCIALSVTLGGCSNPAGIILSGISGTVTIDGVGLADIPVTLFRASG